MLAQRPTSAPADRLLERLDMVRASGTGWVARCPAHEDRHPSLSVAVGADGRVLVTCHAGCSIEAIVGALDLTVADLFPATQRADTAVAKAGPALVRVTPYEICDTAGVPQAIHERRDWADRTKDFLWRGPDGQLGLGGRRETSLPLYRSETLAGVPLDTPVFVVEGESAADALARLVPLPVLGTVTGAAATPGGDALAVLRRRPVFLWPDNDEVGRAHMARVAEALLPLAASVRILHVSGLPPKGDAADFVAAGRDVDELLGHAKLADRYLPDVAGVPSPIPITDQPPEFGPVTIRLSEVQAEPVAWLWPQRLPLGKLTILEGDPGLGKSTIALDVAARVTTGRPMPDGTPGGAPAAVVVLSAEDGMADTIRPRLEAAGADLSRVITFVVRAPDGEHEPSIPGDLDALEAVVTAEGAKLVIVDPLMAYLGGSVNSWRDQDVRRALAPLSAVAERTGAAVLVIRHLNKSRGGSPLYRGGGSIGITGAARTVLLAAPDPDDEERRILAVSKCNLAPLAPALAYRIVPGTGGEVATSVIAWDGPSGHTAAGLLAPPQGHAGEGQRPAQREAMDVLLQILADGPLPAKEARLEARAAGIADRTLDRARQALGIVAKKVGQPGAKEQRWEWALPPKGAKPTPTDGAPEHGIGEGRQPPIDGALGVLRGVPAPERSVAAPEIDGPPLPVWAEYGSSAYLDEDAEDLPA